MKSLKRWISGGHTPVEIRWHLALLGVVFWTLVACARLGYPVENDFSIRTEMLSALGSFEARYNPEWFWLFTIAMIYCGLAMMPIVLYIHRRFTIISRPGAMVGALFFFVGCLGMVLVGLFPYANVSLVGDWEWEHFHMLGAALLILGFGMAIPCHGAMLITDACTKKAFASQEKRAYLKLVGPFLTCAPVMAFVGYQIRWDCMGAALQAALRAKGNEIGGNLSHALGNFPSFPILEHVAIWVLSIFVIWFTMMLPYRGAQGFREGQTDFQE